MDFEAEKQQDPMQMHFKQRRERVKQKCTELGLMNVDANAWEFLINRNYHIVWCNVFKAASSSWIYNFNLLAG